MYWYTVALAVSRECTALSWKSDFPSSISKWKSQKIYCMPLEKITYILKNRYDVFLSSLFIEYMETLPLSTVDWL